MNAVVIGASSGGPKADKELLQGLPSDFDAVVIVIQHLPGEFTKSFAKRLNGTLPMPVKEVEDGEELRTSQIYVVPGYSNFFITSPGYKTKLIKASGLVRPSIDMGFTSVAEHFGKNTIGVVLTGMGKDGVLGSKAIRQLGGTVITQDESTSDVYGMPFEVKLAGYADEVLPLDQIASRLIQLCNKDGHI